MGGAAIDGGGREINDSRGGGAEGFEQLGGLGGRDGMEDENAGVEMRGEIFERDDYLCHFCGKQTEKTTIVPYDHAPTIDHLMPLAKGGLHTRANVATACFKCNWMKSDSLTVDTDHR